MLHVPPNNSVQKHTTLIDKKATLIAEAEHFEDQKTASVHVFTRGSSEHKYTAMLGNLFPFSYKTLKIAHACVYLWLGQTSGDSPKATLRLSSASRQTADL